MNLPVDANFIATTDVRSPCRSELVYTSWPEIKEGHALPGQRETHIEVSKERTRVVNEYVRGSGVKLFQAGPMKAGLRNTSSERRKVTLEWAGTGRHEYELEPHSQIVIDALGGKGVFIDESVLP